MYAQQNFDSIHFRVFPLFLSTKDTLVTMEKFI